MAPFGGAATFLAQHAARNFLPRLLRAYFLLPARPCNDCTSLPHAHTAPLRSASAQVAHISRAAGSHAELPTLPIYSTIPLMRVDKAFLARAFVPNSDEYFRFVFSIFRLCGAVQ